MLKNTNYYLLCTISQLEKSYLKKMNDLTEEYNKYSFSSSNGYDKETEELNKQLENTIEKRDIFEKQLEEMKEKNDIIKNKMIDTETKYNILHNQLQDTEEKHTFITTILEETITDYKKLECEYTKTLEERNLIHESLEEYIIKHTHSIKVLDEKKRHNDDLHSQVVQLMMELEKQKEILKNKIDELEKQNKIFNILSKKYKQKKNF